MRSVYIVSIPKLYLDRLAGSAIVSLTHGVYFASYLSTLSLEIGSRVGVASRAGSRE